MAVYSQQYKSNQATYIHVKELLLHCWGYIAMVAALSLFEVLTMHHPTWHIYIRITVISFNEEWSSGIYLQTYKPPKKNLKPLSLGHSSFCQFEPRLCLFLFFCIRPPPASIYTKIVVYPLTKSGRVVSTYKPTNHYTIYS
jgi:hypothetical protein